MNLLIENVYELVEELYQLTINGSFLFIREQINGLKRFDQDYLQNNDIHIKLSSKAFQCRLIQTFNRIIFHSSHEDNF